MNEKQLLKAWLESYVSTNEAETPTTSESTIERYLVQAVKAFNRGRPEDDKARIYKNVPTQTAGIPDRTLYFRGEALFIEVKRPFGGVVSKIQLLVQQDLKGAGFHTIIVKSSKDVSRVIQLLKTWAEAPKN